MRGELIRFSFHAAHVAAAGREYTSARYEIFSFFFSSLLLLAPQPPLPPLSPRQHTRHYCRYEEPFYQPSICWRRAKEIHARHDEHAAKIDRWYAGTMTLLMPPLFFLLLRARHWWYFPKRACRVFISTLQLLPPPLLPFSSPSSIFSLRRAAAPAHDDAAAAHYAIIITPSSIRDIWQTAEYLSRVIFKHADYATPSRRRGAAAKIRCSFMPPIFTRAAAAAVLRAATLTPFSIFLRWGLPLPRWYFFATRDAVAL